LILGKTWSRGKEDKRQSRQAANEKEAQAHKAGEEWGVATKHDPLDRRPRF
jgi:hypothetical protein